MTRYSREEIDEMLAEANGHMNYIEYENIISQLLEEVRILREGLEFYADKKSWYSPYDDSGKGPEIFEDEGQLARETLTKADEVGKGEYGEEEMEDKLSTKELIAENRKGQIRTPFKPV